MKLKLIAVILAFTLGAVALFSTVSDSMEKEATYSRYIEKARMNADKDIPYNAYQNYKQAFEIHCEDEDVFREYLEQSKLLGEDYYAKAIEEYAKHFPQSELACELLCRRYYDQGNYKSVITTALDARDKGVATEQVRDWYLECTYMLKNIRSGLEEAGAFVGGYARIKANGVYGFIMSNGKYLIAPRYEQASVFLNGNAAVLEDGRWQMINSLGFRVALTDTPVDSMSVMVNGKIPVSRDGKYGYTDVSLIVPEQMEYDYAGTFKNGVAAVKKGGKWALIDASEQPITEFIFDEIVLDEYDTCINAGVIFVRKDGKYYMMNAEGAKISEQSFDYVQPFASGKLAAVCIGGAWGFADTTGSIVIEPQYENARSFGADLGGVCIDGLWGYISSNGTIRVECQFEDCRPFSTDGIAAVKQGDTWQYVQLLGYQVHGG